MSNRFGVLALFLFFSIFFSLSGIEIAEADIIVGVSPPIVDLGVVDRGDTIIAKFNVVTPSEDTILLFLDKSPGQLDFFSAGSADSRIKEYSEEDVTSWINFIDNPVELSIEDRPEDVDVGERGLREVKFVLQVPEDAEPGYHIFNIVPNPVLAEESIPGAGARVVSVSLVSFIFKVPGEVVRDGFILDVTPGNYIGDRLFLNTFFKNTGTVTMSANSVQDIQGAGRVFSNLKSPTTKVKPDETTALQSIMVSPQIGEYRANTVVDFRSGIVSKESTFLVTELPELVVEEPVAPQPEEGIPTTIVIIIIVVIVIISVLIYKWYK